MLGLRNFVSFSMAILLIALAVGCSKHATAEHRWADQIVPDPLVFSVVDEDCYYRAVAAGAFVDPDHPRVIRQFIDTHFNDWLSMDSMFRVLIELAHHQQRPRYLELAIHADAVSPYDLGGHVAELSALYGKDETLDLLVSIATSDEREDSSRAVALRSVYYLCEDERLCDVDWPAVLTAQPSSRLTLFALRAALACCPSAISKAESASLIEQATADVDFDYEADAWLVDQVEELAEIHNSR